MWALLTTLFCSFLVCIYHVFISNSWYHLLKPHWYSIIYNITFLSGQFCKHYTWLKKLMEIFFLVEITRVLCTCKFVYLCTCILVHFASSGHSVGTSSGDLPIFTPRSSKADHASSTPFLPMQAETSFLPPSTASFMWVPCTPVTTFCTPSPCAPMPGQQWVICGSCHSWGTVIMSS